MDKARIAELRREIEAIQELERSYRTDKRHSTARDQIVHAKRLVRLQEIKKELDAVRKRVEPRNGIHLE